MAEPRACSSKYNDNDKEESEENESEMEISDFDSDGKNLKPLKKPLSVAQPEKKKKRGIIYLSSIPKYMNVTKVREIFSEYGEIGRVYLQLADHGLFSVIFITSLLRNISNILSISSFRINITSKIILLVILAI